MGLDPPEVVVIGRRSCLMARDARVALVAHRAVVRSRDGAAVARTGTMELRPQLKVIGRWPRPVDLRVTRRAVVLRGRLPGMTGGAGIHPLDDPGKKSGVLLHPGVALGAGDLRLRVARMRESDLRGLLGGRAPDGLAVGVEEPGDLLLQGLLRILVQFIMAVHAESLRRHSGSRLLLGRLVAVAAGDSAPRVRLVVEGARRRTREGKDR